MSSMTTTTQVDDTREEEEQQQQQQQQHQQLLAVTLEKPLGIILEEVQAGGSEGVFVLDINPDGSAATCEERDQILGKKVATVMGEDVTQLSFDDVFDKLLQAPNAVNLEFMLVAPDQQQPSTNGSEPTDGTKAAPAYEVGTTVTISVLQEGRPETTIQAKVGDNLRQVLLANNIEVYKGLKKKLGNCGGAGQCTFCAAEFLQSDGWEPRSDYENQKLPKNLSARLTCLNVIQGPATLRI